MIIVQTKRDTSADLSEAKNQEIHSWLECLLWILWFILKCRILTHCGTYIRRIGIAL